MESKTLSQIISSLSDEDTCIVNSLHKTALALGYTVKITPAGKKPGDWKCEYIAERPKRTLYILRITGQRFYIRAKLFHLAEYIDVLKSCTEHCKIAMLSASKNCGKHDGGCGRPVTFIIEGKTYCKCRHFFLFKNILPEDVDGIRRLLQKEAQYSLDR